MALVAALGDYWFMRDRHAEALKWIERALSLPGADADPALGVRVLYTKAQCLSRVGRGAAEAAVAATAEAVARQLGDPILLSQVLQRRATKRSPPSGSRWPTRSPTRRSTGPTGDEWEIAEASQAKAIAASSIADLRDRVDRAAALLTDAGNVHELANLLTDAAYAALCLGNVGDAADSPRGRPRSRARWTIGSCGWSTAAILGWPRS